MSCDLDPFFYGATYCVGCQMHRPLAEFNWDDGEPMDPAKWSGAEHERITAAYEGHEKQPLNDRTLATIETELQSHPGAYIEMVDEGGFDGHSYRVVLGSYEVTDETVQKLARRGVIEPFANGCGYSVKRQQTSAASPPVAHRAPADPMNTETP